MAKIAKTITKKPGTVAFFTKALVKLIKMVTLEKQAYVHNRIVVKSTAVKLIEKWSNWSVCPHCSRIRQSSRRTQWSQLHQKCPIFAFFCRKTWLAKFSRQKFIQEMIPELNFFFSLERKSIFLLRMIEKLFFAPAPNYLLIASLSIYLEHQMSELSL